MSLYERTCADKAWRTEKKCQEQNSGLPPERFLALVILASVKHQP